MQAQNTVFRTLAYFSYFSYPLTAFELWKWQYKPEEVLSYDKVLEGLERLDGVSRFRGIYALGSHAEVREQVLERHRRYRNAIMKERKLRKVLRYLARVRDIEGVAICNSLPFHFTEPRSDIDLFVVARPGRVSAARFACVAPLATLRQRPGEAKVDPVDTSFFVTSDAMQLENICLEGNDPYMAYWVKTLTPVLGKDALWDTFFQENAWADAVLPNAQSPKRAYAVRQKSGRKKFVAFPNSMSRRVQERKFSEDVLDMMNTGSQVVVSDSMLKFHKNDRREAIRSHLEQLCKN